MLLAPAVAVNVPPQVLAPLGMAAISTSAGKTSFKASALKAMAPAWVLSMVMVKVEMPPTAMVDGAKLLAMLGSVVAGT